MYSGELPVAELKQETGAASTATQSDSATMRNCD